MTLLVNNASEFQPDDVETLGEAQWDRHFAVNLRAPAFHPATSHGLLPDELAGSIVNIVDQRVLKLTPLFFSYTLTKAALFAATHMAQALAPASARTPSDRVRRSPIPARAMRISPSRAAVLLKRGPTPAEIADAILFLARSPSITGQMIAVDGGQHLAWRRRTSSASTSERDRGDQPPVIRFAAVRRAAEAEEVLFLGVVQRPRAATSPIPHAESRAPI